MIPYLLTWEFPPPPIIVHDFELLLAKILKNKQCLEEFFQKNPCPNVDVVTVKDFNEDIVRICHETFYKENDHWVMETTTFPFSKDKLPFEISKKLKESESEDKVDITEFIEAELDKFKGNETANGVVKE